MQRIKRFVLAAWLALGGQSWAEVLPVPQCTQEQSYWCWLATSQCVLAHDGVKISQCELLQFVLKQENKSSDVCKNPDQFNWGEQVFGVAKILESWNISSSLIESALSYDQIRAQISRKNPIVRFIVWSGGKSHDTIIRGFSSDASGSKLVHVMDPAAGMYISTYDDVVSNEYGRWEKSLTTNGLTANYPWSDINLPGSDFKHSEVSKSYLCADDCWRTDGCVAWTYVRPNTTQGPKGQCWLKNAMPKQVPDSCCESGTKGEQNIDRPGSDYKHFDNINGKSVTEQSCHAACRGEKRCKAWTYVKPNTIQGPKGICWLKDAVPAPVRNKACTSGIAEYQYWSWYF